MLDFIERSPSSCHAVANVCEMLKKCGFTEIREQDSWQLEQGKSYYVLRNDSSLIAFRLPESTQPKGFHIVAAHSDSPSFKLKEAPEMTVEDRYVRLNTEKYGGMILSTWLDRPLSIAGRVAVREKDTIVTKLVNIDKDLLVIPNVAIHMNREMNKGVEYNPQIDMLPLYADASQTR